MTKRKERFCDGFADIICQELKPGTIVISLEGLKKMHIFEQSEQFFQIQENDINGRCWIFYSKKNVLEKIETIRINFHFLDKNFDRVTSTILKQKLQEKEILSELGINLAEKRSKIQDQIKSKCLKLDGKVCQSFSSFCVFCQNIFEKEFDLEFFNLQNGLLFTQPEIEGIAKLVSEDAKKGYALQAFLALHNDIGANLRDLNVTYNTWILNILCDENSIKQVLPSLDIRPFAGEKKLSDQWRETVIKMFDEKKEHETDH